MDTKNIPERILYLAKKKVDGVASKTEEGELDDWYHSLNNTHAEQFWLELTAERENKLYRQIVDKAHIRKKEGVKANRTIKHTWAIAALICISLSVGLMLYIRPSHTISAPDLQVQQIDIQAGTDRATLFLANGQKIDLDSQYKSILIGEDKITYEDGSPVTKVDDALQGMVTLSTPRGGQFHAVLPDGTRVWLNAASSLTYPLRFSEKERRVQLKGEAYFEVAHISGENSVLLPFVVKSKNQEVAVLGTQFNINSYEDEPFVKTTLLEGSVRVSIADNDPSGERKSILLAPKQQAWVAGQAIQVKNAPTANAIAWQQGKFVFNNASINELMRQISRWYDVEVVYGSEVRKRAFIGEIDRNTPLSKVLRILEISGLKFTVEGRTITVID